MLSLLIVLSFAHANQPVKYNPEKLAVTNPEAPWFMASSKEIQREQGMKKSRSDKERKHDPNL